MTVITDKTVYFLYPAPLVPRYLIDPVAFFIALIGGPLIITAMTFWVFLVPVFALVLGGPVYLVIGTPLLLWTLRYREPKPDEIAVLAFRSTFGLCAVIVIYALITSKPEILTGLPFFGAFSLIFAPLWGNQFCKIYLKLRRDIYAPRPT